jgi:tRNA-binding protein
MTESRSATIEDFLKLDIRVGTIERVEDFPEARNPAYQIWVNFGEAIGVKKSSAQVTQNYSKDDLIGRQVAAVTNFPPRQIGKFMSEILILGFPDDEKNVTLVGVDKQIPNGGRLY